MRTLKKLKKQKPLSLNLGCGSAKISGCVNIDIEASCKPDLVHDFTKKQLPYPDNSVEEVYLFHTIEHISKRLHRPILQEIHRVLKINAPFWVSYPEFSKIIENWKTNKRGLRQFWEATIYGRQLYPSDYHVCIMDSFELKQLLSEVGFVQIVSESESTEDYNTVTTCLKGIPYITYEELIAKSTSEMKLVKG